MPVLVREAALADDELAAVLRPRTGLVAEREVEPGRFVAADGPVRDYERVVSTAADGAVRQEVRYRLAIPYFGFLFALAVRRRLGALPMAPGMPWWAPPDTLDRAAGAALGSLAAISIVVGYMGTLLSQTITFAAEDFGADEGAQGVALALVRADVVVSLLVVGLADRRGRRRVLLGATAIGCVLTATGAFAPGIAWLAGSQVLTRGFVTAAAIVITVIAAEEMPAGSRAYAISVLALTAALGAGICVMLLFLAEAVSWRVLWLVPLAFLPVVAHIARHLPESRRFVAIHADARVSGHGGRVWLLAVSAFLLALFTTPASQFQNEFLRTERGYSASGISAFTVLTNTPGAVGVVVGGRLADVRGRRLVGAVALLGGVGATVLMFLSSGAALWAWSFIGAIVGGATVPALTVYGPELFPTSLRGRANGLITGLGRIGSVIGLLAAGFLARRLGSITPAIALLALGPAVLAVLVLVAYPETAHRELEELNPEDAPGTVAGP